VPNVCDDSQADRLLVQVLRGGTPTDAAAVLAAGMLGDLRLASLGTAGIEFPDSFGKPNDVLLIQVRPALGGAGAPRLPCGGVRRALLLRLLEGGFFDQESLAFVSLSRPTPF
jgi:hypothetical protein